MLFKEAWVISAAGIGLASSPAFIFGDKLLDVSISFPKRPDRGRWIVVKGKDDYSGKGYGDSWIKLTVEKKDNNKQRYRLTRPYKDIDFSLPFKVDDSKLSNIQTDQIKIHLLKKPIWDDVNLAEDQFEAIDKSQVSELFQNKDASASKIKKLLLSLSSRRYWKRTDEWNFFPLFDFYRPKDETSLTYNLKIKYFKDFNKLKDYVHKQIEKCPESGNCEASSEGLDILDQDKLEFFKEPE